MLTSRVRAGTRYLTEQLLWGLRNDDFERAALNGRKSPCSKCGAKKKYFCEKCTEIVGNAACVPSVRLPLDIAVIRDERENKAKVRVPEEPCKRALQK